MYGSLQSREWRRGEGEVDFEGLSLQDREIQALTGAGWRMGARSGTEQQRNKGRTEFEADFEFFEDRTQYLNYYTDICQTDLGQ